MKIHCHARRAGPVLIPCLLLLVTAGTVIATPIVLTDSGTAAFVGQAQQGPLDQPVLVESYAQFTAAFGASTVGLANPFLAPSVAAFFANGGQHLWVVRVAGADDASIIGADGGSPGSRTGLQALRDVASVALVAIPGAVAPAVQAALVTHCESTGYRLAILDPVSPNDVNAVMAQRTALTTADGYATLYFPWVQAAPAGVSLLLPPSGFVAGVMARTSPPVAPTGTVATATAVSYAANTTEQSQLNVLGIDVIRYLSGTGVQIWGARTIASNSEWIYVPVRRAGLAIEASVQAGTAWCLQQTNDAALWTQLRSDVTDFMQGLFVAGWFQGTTPSQAYFVRCDQTTMTQSDLAAGRTIIQAGFAPIRPAEFIVLAIVQQRSFATGVPSGQQALSLAPPRPNPFNPSTTIRFELPDSGPVQLSVHDVAGRLVRMLVDEGMAQGSHDAVWDGMDSSGRHVGSGSYLARLEFGGKVETARMVLVK